MTDYTDLLTAAEQKYGLPAGILQGQMAVESGGDPKAKSGKGALGLMQFTPATAKAYGVNTADPASSIDGAARFMADNLKASNGNVAEALRLYQGGPNRAGWGKENAAYAGKVLNSMPGDSGDLAAMGLSAPTATPTVSADDHVDLDSAGLSAPADYAAAKKELDGLTGSLKSAPDDLSAGINKIVAAGGGKPEVDQFLAKSGYDPTKTTGVDDAIKWARQNKAGINVLQHDAPTIAPVPLKPSDSTAANFGQGGRQGLEDIGKVGAEVSKWVDDRVPALAALDKAGSGGVFGDTDPNSLLARYGTDRAIYDQTAGKTLAGNLGRIGGNIVGTAPMIAGGGAAIGAGLEAAGAPAAAQFIGGTAGGNLLTRGASLAANGAATGTAGALLTGQDPTAGAIGGAVLGPVGGAVGAGAKKLAQAVAPTISPAVARLAQTAGDMGIPIRPSQLSGSPFVKGLDSLLGKIPGSGMTEANDAQRGAFMRAVGKTFGADSEALTPDVMQKAKSDIGDTLNDVAARTRIHADDQLINDLGQIEHEAPQALTESEAKPLSLQINNILSKIGPDGTIDGKTYQALTRKGAPLDVAESNHDSNIAHYAGQIRDALDSALQRSASPEDLSTLKAARLAYKNMKTVEPLVSKSPDGTFNPALLNNRVSTNFKNRAYSGAGDLGDLAAIGQRFIKPTPSSDTAENERLLGVLALGGKLGVGAAGAMLGHSAGLEPLAAAGAGIGGFAGTSAVSRIATKALSSPAYRNRLISAALDANDTSVPSTLSGYYLPAATLATNRLLQGSGVGSKR